MPRVDVQRLLALPDGSSQGKVGLHHPLLVVAVDNGLRRHGQRVTLGDILGQSGERLFGLKKVNRQMQSVRKQTMGTEMLHYIFCSFWFVFFG